VLKTTSEIIPRASVEAIVGHRDTALRRYGETFVALCTARDTGKQAVEALLAAAPITNRYNYHSRGEKTHFLAPLELPTLDVFTAEARKMVDRDVWAHIIQLTDLERIMDKTAKDQFHREMTENPPEATIDNIYATLEQFALDAGTIFRRGIAECFSKLDRRFRSHDGWKIGSRVILTYCFDESGFFNYHHNHRDTIQDIERTFLVLDGKTPPPNYAGIVGVVQAARDKTGGWGRRQTECENDYFKINCYKNGNAHVWFKRDNLLVRVNKLLAEYYGEVISEERAPEQGSDLFTPKTSLAKNHGFFPTPDNAAKNIVDKVPLWREPSDPFLTVLEPSAGTGNLARLLATDRHGREHTYRAAVDCVEIQPLLAEKLRAERLIQQHVPGPRLYRKVMCCDFLALAPDPTNLYDRVVMNPPFDRERDVDHVIHALSFLKADGFLTAIMSAGTEFRDTSKSTKFRSLMERLNARYHDLPAGSFSSVGTNVNAIVLRVWKDGRSFY
jgi:hypothetical protein